MAPKKAYFWSLIDLLSREPAPLTLHECPSLVGFPIGRNQAQNGALFRGMTDLPLFEGKSYFATLLYIRGSPPDYNFQHL